MNAVLQPVSTATPKARKLSFHVLDDGRIRAEFGPGENPVDMHPNQMAPALDKQAITEGIISRLRGFAANVEDRTPEKLRAAIEKGVTALKEGHWRVERESTAAESFTIEQEAAHLFRVMRADAAGESYDGTLEESAAAFDALADEKKKELKALPRYKAAYARVKLERQQKTLAKLEKKADEEAVEDEGF